MSTFTPSQLSQMAESIYDESACEGEFGEAGLTIAAMLRQAARDAERLDELELGKRADVRWNEGGEQELVGYEWGCGGPYATVRDALDAAIDARRTQEKQA